MNPRRDLVLVTAGLELDGGGRAAVGRLLCGACADFARREGIRFRVLSLRGTGPAPAGVDVRGFRANRARLALAAARCCTGRPRPAVLFDLLGLARSVAFVPRGWCGPYMLVLHGLEVWRPFSLLDLRILDGAFQRIAFSAHTRERARKFVGDLASSIDVLPLALEDRSPDGTADSALLDRLGTGFLLMAGRMSVSERYKGHDQVLKAFAEVSDRLPNAHLVIAGGGDDRARLEAAAAGAGLDDQVTFTGFVSEVTLSELFSRCLAFVMPSRGEGFGLVYLEAMRAAKPCLAATGSAAEEIVMDGETGILVDADDEQALAQAMIRLLSDPALAERLGQAGRARWQQHFSLHRFQSGLGQYFDRLTALDHVRH